MADKHTIIAVATDDMAITSKHTANILKFKSKIRKHWEITDNGPIAWFLGFQIICDQKSRPYQSINNPTLNKWPKNLISPMLNWFQCP